MGICVKNVSAGLFCGLRGLDEVVDGAIVGCCGGYVVALGCLGA